MAFANDVAVRTLWGEARGERDEGILAVAHVILNRVADGRWGPNAATVCLWPMQFSCWNANDPNRMKILMLDETDADLARCQTLYDRALYENDPTDGACFYFADSMTSPPSWAASMIETARIGRHRFFKDR